MTCIMNENSVVYEEEVLTYKDTRSCIRQLTHFEVANVVIREEEVIRSPPSGPLASECHLQNIEV